MKDNPGVGSFMFLLWRSCLQLLFNRQSTDAMQGYPCYSETTSQEYLNRSDVADAFHIDEEFYKGGGVFQMCK
jgi:hypothetical protein